jgi:citrate lyase beta subunit
METYMRARRALLYMPGDDRHKIEKALTLGVDCVCMDMEDGVAPNRKTEARPDGVVVPKVETLEQIQWVSGEIEAAELACGWPMHSIRLLVMVETPKAILNLKEIASHPHLEALIFGGEDYAASVGARRTPGALELLYARSAVVTACAAHGLQAIDMISVDFKDLEALRREADFGAQLGFTGKQVIHPSQVAPVQEAFTPDEAAIESARRLVEAFEAHQAEGAGVFARDGRMVELPHVKAARCVLKRARAAGKIT